MARIDDLEKRIEALEERLDLLAGKTRGPITMTEFRLACERKDKATIRRYLDQEEKGGPRQSSALCGASAVKQNQQEGAGDNTPWDRRPAPSDETTG